MPTYLRLFDIRIQNKPTDSKGLWENLKRFDEIPAVLLAVEILEIDNFRKILQFSEKSLVTGKLLQVFYPLEETSRFVCKTFSWIKSTRQSKHMTFKSLLTLNQTDSLELKQESHSISKFANMTKNN